MHQSSPISLHIWLLIKSARGEHKPSDKISSTILTTPWKGAAMCEFGGIEGIHKNRSAGRPANVITFHLTFPASLHQEPVIISGHSMIYERQKSPWGPTFWSKLAIFCVVNSLNTLENGQVLGFYAKGVKSTPSLLGPVWQKTIKARQFSMLLKTI